MREYKYLVFEDEAKHVYVIRDTQLRDCIFARSIGKIKEIERGIFEKPESGSRFGYLGQLINKRREYLAKGYK
jgi:hypothetical protein